MHRCILTAAVVLGTAWGPAAAEEITLAAPGAPPAAILLAADADASERWAARELAAYLGRATGSTFSIVAETAADKKAAAIHVGPTRFAQRHSVRANGLEQWVIRTVSGRLILAGGRPRGVLYAVCRFLEDHIGVRWWTPWDEHVPRRRALRIGPIDRNGQPAFAYRDMVDDIYPKTLWYARNRINGHLTYTPRRHGGAVGYGLPSYVHAFKDYIPAKEYFARHPEYFSLVGGRRRKGRSQLSLVHPDVRRLFIEKLRAYVRESYRRADQAGMSRPVMFSISPNDCQFADETPEAKKLVAREGQSGELLWFVNQIADAIRTEHPEILIDTLAYSYYLAPPKTLRPRDNVCIRVCLTDMDHNTAITHANNRHMLRPLTGWSKITKRLRVWYYSPLYDGYTGAPSVQALVVADSFRHFRRLGAEGMFIENQYPVLQHLRDLQAWMYAKLMEDPDRDPAALLKEFTDGFYGPAGRHIRRYLQRLRRANTERPTYLNWHRTDRVYRLLDAQAVLNCHRIFDEAEGAIAGRRDLLARVRHARLSIDRLTVRRYRHLFGGPSDRSGRRSTRGPDPTPIAQRAVQTIRKKMQERFTAREVGWRHRPAAWYDKHRSRLEREMVELSRLARQATKAAGPKRP